MSQQAILTTSKVSETGTWTPSAGGEETAIRTVGQKVTNTFQGVLRLRGDWTAPTGSTVNSVAITITIDGQENASEDDVFSSLRISVNGTQAAPQTLATVAMGTNPSASTATKTFTGPWTAAQWNATDNGGAGATFSFNTTSTSSDYLLDWKNLSITADYTLPALTLSSPTVGTSGNTFTATLSESGCTPTSGTIGFYIYDSHSNLLAQTTSWTISGTTITGTLNHTIYQTDTSITITVVSAETGIQNSATTAINSYSGLSVTNNSTAVFSGYRNPINVINSSVALGTVTRVKTPKDIAYRQGSLKNINVIRQDTIASYDKDGSAASKTHTNTTLTDNSIKTPKASYATPLSIKNKEII